MNFIEYLLSWSYEAPLTVGLLSWAWHTSPRWTASTPCRCSPQSFWRARPSCPAASRSRDCPSGTCNMHRLSTIFRNATHTDARYFIHSFIRPFFIHYYFIHSSFIQSFILDSPIRSFTHSFTRSPFIISYIYYYSILIIVNKVFFLSFLSFLSFSIF